MDKISVIVPIYKVEKYLNKCIDSILGQTYTNIEVILVDDGSPDQCPEICDKYAEKDTRIRVIHKKNGGLSDARNTGIDCATGAYLLFVDSDDYIAPNMLEKLYTALQENNADMSICNFKYVKENGTGDYDNVHLPIQNGVLSGKDILLNKLFEEKSWYWVVAWNKLYKKSLFKKLRYPVGKIHEDEFIIHQLIFKCKKIACVSDMLYFYLQRNGSIMNSDRNIRELDAVEALFQRAAFYASNNELTERAVEILLKGIIKFQSYCYKIDKKSEKKSKKRFYELQDAYCCAYRQIKLNNIMISNLENVKLKLNFVSLYWMWEVSRIRLRWMKSI